MPSPGLARRECIACGGVFYCYPGNAHYCPRCAPSARDRAAVMFAPSPLMPPTVRPPLPSDVDMSTPKRCELCGDPSLTALCSDCDREARRV